MAVVSLQPQAPPPTKQDFNTDYLRTPSAVLRIALGLLALSALICTAEGYCVGDGGRYAYSLFLLVVTMLEVVLILVAFVLRLDEKLPGVDFILSLLLNDAIAIILYFIVTTLAFLSIGRCNYAVAARILAALFSLGIFLVLVGLTYINYLSWQDRQAKTAAAAIKNTGMGTTVTENSPTVLT